MPPFEYESVRPATRSELTSQFQTGDPEAVANALHSAARYDPDWKWVQEQCLKYLQSPSTTVRWAAATCLGDLALFRRPLDVPVVVAALEKAADDPEIAGPARDSLSMVREFLGKK